MIIKKPTVWLILLTLLLLSNGLYCKVLILPFKTDQDLNKSYYWLSRAISFYLSTQLNSIEINSFTDSEVTKIIYENSLNFPYRFTKASAIRIGLENNADKIIWGKIIISKDKDTNGNITIRSYIIDLISFKQQYLPIIKSNVENISLVQKELFNAVTKRLEVNPNIENQNIIEFDNQSYELFIKSLLSNNDSERKNLLNNSLNLIKQNNGIESSIDLINFELAKVYFKEGKLNSVESYLNKIGPKSIIWKNKLFLKALLDSDIEDLSNAIKKFLSLKKQKSFNKIIDNNLGVLYIKTENFALAERFLLDALTKKKSITVYNNLFNLYLKWSDKEKIKSKLIEVLNVFPKNLNYISLLHHFIKQDVNKEILLSVFNNFLEDKLIIDYYKLELQLVFINPFDISTSNEISKRNKKNNIFRSRNLKNNKNLVIEDHLQNLYSNLFNYDTHLALSALYKDKKQFRKAEMYAIFADFLHRSKRSINNLIKIYKVLGKSSKVNELNIVLTGFESE